MSDTQQTAPRRGRKRFEIAVHVGGTTTTLRALAKQRGLSYQMVRGRIERLGWPLEQALATPASAWRRDRRAQALPEDNAEDSTQAPHPADGCESCERLAAKIARLEAEREHIRDSLRFEVGDVWQIGTACTVITETFGDGRSGYTVGSKCRVSPFAARLVQRAGQPWKWPFR